MSFLGKGSRAMLQPVDVIDKAWERRDCVEDFTKEDEHESWKLLFSGGNFDRINSTLAYTILAGLVSRSPAL